MRLLLPSLVAVASARRPCPVRQEAAAEGYPVPLELYFGQQLDHFDDKQTTTWQHRYFLNDDKWDGRMQLANGCPGPILLYTGNEGPIDAFWNVSGFVVETLAKNLGGLVLFSEQRYYGASLPFGDASNTPEHLQYLTTAQCVADHAAVAEHVKATVPGASDCPVVAFGGSYGGTLTALLRATYPDTVIGGVAASSELGYYDEDKWAAHGIHEFSFEDVVISTWDQARPGCLHSVKTALDVINAVPAEQVVDAFGLCDAKVLGPGPSSDFFAYVLEGMPQGDYASNGNPVAAACDLLIAASSPSDTLAATAKIVQNFYGQSSCIAFDVGGPGNTPGDGPGDSSSWGYQSCSETLHTFSAHTLRNYTFDLAMSSALCAALYNNSVNAVPVLDALTKTFGSPYDMAQGRTPKGHDGPVTNLIWTQGTLDPWHGWFNNMSRPPTGLEIYQITIKDGAHHEDLRLPCEDDKPAVVGARMAEETIIRQWIGEATKLQTKVA